jgi:hypothetical protein
MKTIEALKLVGGLSKPSKMPGWAYGIPAAECKTGGILKNVKGSTCEGCYADKGCYVFPVVQAAQYRRLESIKHKDWVRAMVALINSKKSKWFQVARLRRRAGRSSPREDLYSCKAHA